MDQRSVHPAGSNVPSGPADTQSGTLLDLLHRLSAQLSTLFRQEMRLAGAELFSSATALLSSLATVASGGAVMYAGFLVILFAAVVGLANVLPIWLAALSVGVLVAIVGYALLLIGRKKLKGSDLAPTHSTASLHRDAEVLTRKAS